MKNSKALLGQVAIIGFVILADQLTKFLVKKLFLNSAEVVVIPGLLTFTFVRNKGVAFGLYEGLSLYLSLAGFIGLLITLVFFPEILKQKLSFWFLPLIIGGAISNFIDRLFYGWVTDFINIPFFSVFNLADVAITAGVVLLIYDFLFLKGDES